MRYQYTLMSWQHFDNCYVLGCELQIVNLPMCETDYCICLLMTLNANSHIACRSHTAPMPFPCHAVPLSLGMCLSHLIYTVRPCLIHTCHAMPMPCSNHAVLLKATTQYGRNMATVNQTRPHCVNQMGKTHSKALAAQPGRETSWVRHGNGMLCVNRP